MEITSDCEIQVRIISKEIIKPSSPTPPHLNKYKLSLLDQLVLTTYIPLVLFFQGPTTTSSGVLKKSLSEILTHFYVLAGRLEDIYTIDCNDEGVEFVDAHISNSMSDYLRQPNQCYNNIMLPFHQLVDPNELINSKRPLLGIQATYFGCGGIGLGVSIHHCVVDASSIATFLTSWAKLTLGSKDIIHLLPVAESCLFPPQDIGDRLNLNLRFCQAKSANMATRRFRFDGSKISELKETISQGSVCVENPTRYEAVTALLWGAAMTICEETGISTCSFFHTVDLRRRMRPPLRPNASGCLTSMVQSQRPLDKLVVDYNCLAGKIRESIRAVDAHYIDFLGSNSNRNTTNAHNDKDVQKSSSAGAADKAIKFIVCNSWCRYPFYECDFGWGKPCWLATVPLSNGMATLLDTEDGDGIDVWLALGKEEMAKFEQNPDILAFSSSKQ